MNKSNIATAAIIAVAASSAIANTTSMGVADFKGAISNGTMTQREVLDILNARINKRVANKKAPVANVISYRNDLAYLVSQKEGVSIPVVAVPAYANKPTLGQTSLGTMSTDPDQLAELILSTVGSVDAGKVIMALTNKLAGK